MNLKKAQFANILPWLSLTTGVFLSILTVTGYSLLVEQENKNIQQKVNQEAINTRTKITIVLDYHISALRRMADRWIFGERNSHLEWYADASNYLRDFTGYVTIEWVNTNDEVQWVAPINGGEKVINLNFLNQTNQKKALEESIRNRSIYISNTIYYIRGKKGFQVYVPMFFHQKFDGFLVGSIKTEDIIYDNIDRRLLKDYNIEIYRNQKLVFSNEVDQPQELQFQSTSSLQYYNAQWNIQLTPSRSFVKAQKSLLPPLVLISGLVISWLFAIAIHFAIKSRQRSYYLSQEIEERRRIAEDLENAKKLADVANQAKSDFLATMSHELRTPMNGVIGLIELLWDTQLNDTQKDFVQTIQQSSDALLTLINDILDFSKIEAGKLTLKYQSFDLIDCIESVINLLDYNAKNKNIQLKYFIDPDTPRMVISAPNRLRQILLNIVGNGIKFTEQGEVNLLVSSECLSQGKEPEYQIRFAVKDTGVGITPDQKERLFQPFSQGDSSTSRKYGGTGLGLVISQRLTEMMGGEIWTESELGQGSTFFFSIVVKKAKTLSDETVSPTPQKTEKNTRFSPPVSDSPENISPSSKILLVEDNIVNQKVALLTLKKLGYQADVVANGVAVLEAIAQHPYDIILMDIQMPEMDGLEATRQIRKNPSTPQPYIIALTANAMKGDSRTETLREREICLEAGMNDYITKPLKIEALQEALNLAKTQKQYQLTK